MLGFGWCFLLLLGVWFIVSLLFLWDFCFSFFFFLGWVGCKWVDIFFRIFKLVVLFCILDWVCFWLLGVVYFWLNVLGKFLVEDWFLLLLRDLCWWWWLFWFWYLVIVCEFYIWICELIGEGDIEGLYVWFCDWIGWDGNFLIDFCDFCGIILVFWFVFCCFVCGVFWELLEWVDCGFLVVFLGFELRVLMVFVF